MRKLAPVLFIAFASAATILTYLSATSKFALIDKYLVAADAAIGLIKFDGNTRCLNEGVGKHIA